MTGFNEALHPRGQAANAGQFRGKANDAPAGALTAPTTDDAADRWYERLVQQGTIGMFGSELALGDERLQLREAYRQGLARAAASPLWCANDAPHDEHTRHNEFGGTDYCSGRPGPADTTLADVPQRASEETLQRVREECVGWFPDDEPLLYEPTDGQQDGWTDIVAVDHESGRTVKFTIGPDDALEAYELRADAETPAPAARATDAEVAAVDDILRAFVARHDLADEDNTDEDPAATVGWSLGDGQLGYEQSLRELIVEARRAAQAEARQNAVRAAAGLWGASTEMPPFEHLHGADSTPAGEYLRGQIETIADSFGWGDAAGDDMPKEAIYREIAAAADGGR
ncbi:MAG: hypothetical protein J0J04_08545 [Microbacterium sp.]|uniref:hypothetical protein n=1 Tax=Microbacterium sp. TaxID=51671 RepID=UPI001AC0FD72|nr:hypothetical protein [Microbacterium sp.]MBN9214825.1 hypothetical protein [Microbacterium sp.]